MKIGFKTKLTLLISTSTILSFFAQAKPYSNQVIINFDAPEIAQALYRKSQATGIPTIIVDLHQPTRVATKEAALEFISTGKAGRVVYWQSSRFAHKYGYLKKAHFGPSTLAEALIIDHARLTSEYEKNFISLAELNESSRVYITGRTIPEGDTLRSEDGSTVSYRELAEIIRRFAPRIHNRPNPIKISLLVDSSAEGGTQSFGAKLSHELWSHRINHQVFARSGAISIRQDSEKIRFLVDGQYKGENRKFLFQHSTDGSFLSTPVDYDEDPKPPITPLSASTGAASGGAASGGGASASAAASGAGASPAPLSEASLPTALRRLSREAHPLEMSLFIDPTHPVFSARASSAAAHGTPPGGAPFTLEDSFFELRNAISPTSSHTVFDFRATMSPMHTQTPRATPALSPATPSRAVTAETLGADTTTASDTPVTGPTLPAPSAFLMAPNQAIAVASINRVAPLGYIAYPIPGRPREFALIHRSLSEPATAAGISFITPELDLLDARQIPVANRSEATARFAELEPGSFFIWKSSSVRGAYAIHGKDIHGSPFSTKPILLE